MAGSELQEHYVSMLLERVRQDRFPSADHMDRIEAMLASPEQLVDYLEVLFEKLEGVRHPSLQMLDRIQRLTAALPRE
jgi:hypothetical protein